MKELSIPPDPARIREYLLRKLPEAERARFEEAYFADDSLLDRVEAEEDVLVSDYVLGRLVEPDRRRFEETLLESPYYRERVETTTRLRRRIQKDKAFLPGTGRVASAGPGGRDLTGKIFPGRTGTIVAFGLLGVLLVAAMVSAFRLKGQLEEARKEAQSLPATAPLLGPAEQAVVILDGTETLASPARKVVRPRGTPLLLAFPRRLLPPGEISFRIRLRTEAGSVTWDSGPLPLPRTEAEGDPLVRVPPDIPSSGRSTVQISGAAAGAWSAVLELSEPPVPSRTPTRP